MYLHKNSISKLSICNYNLTFSLKNFRIFSKISIITADINRTWRSFDIFKCRDVWLNYVLRVENLGWKYSRAFERKRWGKRWPLPLYDANSSLLPLLCLPSFLFVQNFSTNPYSMHLCYCRQLITNTCYLYELK